MVFGVRAEVTPRVLISSFIVFTIILLGGIGWMSSLNDAKGGGFVNNEAFSKFNSSFNKYSDVVSSTSALKDNLVDAQPKKGLFGVLDSLIDVAWGGIRSIFSSFTFLTTAWVGLGSVFGLPSWFISLLSSLVIVALVFSVYSLIFQGKT